MKHRLTSAVGRPIGTAAITQRAFVRLSPVQLSLVCRRTLFADPLAAFQSFRSGRPGERGDRNIFRYPGFVTLDVGLGKTWGMPWSENHKLQFRTEAFNVTNTQRLTSVDGFTQGLDPFKRTANATFGNLTAIQGTPRVLQFALRYSF